MIGHDAAGLRKFAAQQATDRGSAQSADIVAFAAQDRVHASPSCSVLGLLKERMTAVLCMRAAMRGINSHMR